MALTIVRLLNDVGINATYRDSRTFTDVNEQANFFTGKTASPSSRFVRHNLTYLRKESSIMWSENVDSLYTVSYMMFQNSENSGKWFYAFIKEILYENKNTSKIIFEIDEIQTWLFDAELETCMVERMHVEDDTRGKHLLDENLNIGQVTNASHMKLSSLDELLIIASSTEDVDGNSLSNIYGGVYSGLTYHWFQTNGGGLNTLDIWLSRMDMAGKSDSITSLFMYPKIMVDIGSEPIHLDGILQGQSGISKSFFLSPNLSDLKGYIPRNNKLFSYPYNYLMVTNNNGGESLFRYEYFYNTVNLKFTIEGSIGQAPTLNLIPRYYKGQVWNYDEILPLSNYPMCNWKSDIYNNWFAQNKARNAVSVVGSIGAIGVGVATGNPLAVGGGILGFANTLGGFLDTSVKPDRAHGQHDGGANIRSGIQNFGFYAKCVTAEYATILDDYFSRYGYKVMRQLKPNLQTRKYWNYWKMLDVNLSGDIPNTSKEKIIQIFKDGVTFWHMDLVGQYELNNIII